jgi:hypothetical protein
VKVRGEDVRRLAGGVAPGNAHFALRSEDVTFIALDAPETQ